MTIHQSELGRGLTMLTAKLISLSRALVMVVAPRTPVRHALYRWKILEIAGAFDSIYVRHGYAVDESESHADPCYLLCVV